MNLMKIEKSSLAFVQIFIFAVFILHLSILISSIPMRLGPSLPSKREIGTMLPIYLHQRVGKFSLQRFESALSIFAIDNHVHP